MLIARIRFFATTITLCLVVVAGVYALTQPTIQLNDHARAQQHLVALRSRTSLPASAQHHVLTTTPCQFTDIINHAIHQYQEGQRVPLVVFDLSTPNGYGGNIRLLIAVNAQQTISAVDVVSHHETPGLGDKMERTKSHWLDDFNGRSLQNPDEKQWTVQQSGGAFRQWTGATITPRAIIHAIRDTLRCVRRHESQLFTEMEHDTSKPLA